MIIFYNTHFTLLTFVQFLNIFSHVQGKYVNKWDDIEDMQNLWKILEQMPSGQVNSRVQNDYSLEDVEGIKNVQKKQIDYEDFFENSQNYLNRRALTYTKCKVVEHHMNNEEDDEFMYVPKHYDNVTCEKTDEDPFNITLPHTDQYCYIFHHPGNSPSCSTKYRSVSFFKKDRISDGWQRFPQTLGVGCGCTLGFTYRF